MTVYVDDMFKFPMGQFRRMKMSHLCADTEPELHAMADAIGIDRKWYQGDHYDISITKRNLAIKAGAVPVSLRQMAAYRRLLDWGIITTPSIAAMCRYGRDYPTND